jgi:hypothetical protein
MFGGSGVGVAATLKSGLSDRGGNGIDSGGVGRGTPPVGVVGMKAEAGEEAISAAEEKWQQTMVEGIAL